MRDYTSSIFRRTGFFLTIAILTSLTGCMLPRFYHPTVYYTLNPTIAIKQTAKTEHTVGVRPLETTRTYKQPIVFQQPGSIMGNYRSAEWAEMPRDTITRVLLDGLNASGRFADVGNAADMKHPDWILIGQLRRFEEVRTHSPWTAECEVRLELRREESGELIWADTLQAKVPMAHNQVSAIPAAMSAAIAEVVQKAVEEITAK